MGSVVQMAHELQELLEMSRVKRSQIFLANSPHSFLDKIVTPIHKILCAVRFCSNPCWFILKCSQ